jgi:transcriptional regulator with XRE-family HTH domain
MALGASLGRDVSQVEFGELLVHGLLNAGITRGTIWNWESGKFEPDLDFLLSIYTYTFFDRTDWRFHWARECMRAMKPETFDSGVIDLAGDAAEPSPSGA